MATPKVRADYDALNQAAGRFSGQAQAARQTLQSLTRQLDVLQGGDWVGQGASAFYKEMGDSVLPTLQRLAGALESAQQATVQISQIMQQAEAEAARVLRGHGASGTGSSTAGAGGSPGSASASSAAGGVGAPAAAGPAFIPNMGAGPNLRAMAQARARRQLAAENAAVDQMLSIFDPQVQALAKQSPTLRAQMVTLQKKGFMFVTGPLADGFKTIPPFITIGQPMNAADTLNEIAHETGHALNMDHQLGRVVETPAMTRDQYVQANVTNNLRNEAEAQFNAVQVRAELLAAGAGDVGLPGDQDAGFQQVYARFTAGKITRDQAIDQMGPVMGSVVRTYTPTRQTYHDYAVDFFQKDWDTLIAPTRKP